MKKITIKIMMSLIILSIFSYVGICFASGDKIEVLGATYEVTENVLSQDLGYDIHHTKDIAMSSKANNDLYPQSVNVLEVPSREDVRIVNWTQSNASGWSKATVRAMARDFESKNPGWVVVAAVNGDFFDIDGDNKALPYQTGGVTVSLNEVYRPFTNAQTIGFTNSGTKDTLVAEKEFKVTGHILTIYDDNDNEVYKIDVKHLNEEPEAGEVAIWYSYKDNEGISQRVTLPANNTYFAKRPERVLAMSTTNVYAKGEITSINEETLLHYGQFGIQTNNEEVIKYLELGTKIRVQQHVTGDYENCSEITGGGVCLVRNGEAVDNTSDMDTHPRTCVGVKEDGTIVLMTVDGRQDNKNMHGMAYNELTATMLYYGCSYAYNLDGGGSTTMLLRNDYGDFDVLNSPSDGVERHDSNSLLVVVPEMSLKINNVTDTTVEIDYIAPKKDVEIKNIKITLGEETRSIESFPYVWSDLEATTQYEINATYDLKYKGAEEIKSIKPIQIKTGVNKPYIEKAYYYEYQDKLIVNYKIANPSGITLINSINSGSYFDNVPYLEGKMVLDKNSCDPNNIKIILGYNLKSSKPEYVEEETEIVKLNISFNGGLINESELTNSRGYNEMLPILTQSDHEFNGWYINGELADSLENIDINDISIEAKFTSLKKQGCKGRNMSIYSLISSVGIVLLTLKKRK